MYKKGLSTCDLPVKLIDNKYFQVCFFKLRDLSSTWSPYRMSSSRAKNRATEDRQTSDVDVAKENNDSAGIRTRVRRIMQLASAYDTPTLLNLVHH
jgi:hypothetical protein